MDSDNLYFINILKCLPNSDQYNAIRSNLIQRYLGSVSVSYFDQICVCRVCGNNYSNMPMHQIIKPPKKINRFLRRLIQRKPDYGTKFQMKALNEIQKFKNKQTLVKICQFCKINKTRKFCKKTVIQVQVERDLEPMHTDEVRKSVFKKAKKSSQFAGLNKAAVLAVKRAGESDNFNNMHTPKRQKLDSSIIILDTPLINSHNSSKSNTDSGQKRSKRSKLKRVLKTDTNSSKKSEILNLDNIVCINDTPTPKKNIKEPDFINLVTPTTSGVNLTPVTKKSIVTSPLKSKSSKIKENEKTEPNPYSPNNKNISNFLKKTEDLDKTISNLEQFLKSIS